MPFQLQNKMVTVIGSGYGAGFLQASEQPPRKKHCRFGRTKMHRSPWISLPQALWSQDHEHQRGYTQKLVNALQPRGSRCSPADIDRLTARALGEFRTSSPAVALVSPSLDPLLDLNDSMGELAVSQLTSAEANAQTYSPGHDGTIDWTGLVEGSGAGADKLEVRTPSPPRQAYVYTGSPGVALQASPLWNKGRHERGAVDPSLPLRRPRSLTGPPLPLAPQPARHHRSVSYDTSASGTGDSLAPTRPKRLDFSRRAPGPAARAQELDNVFSSDARAPEADASQAPACEYCQQRGLDCVVVASQVSRKLKKKKRSCERCRTLKRGCSLASEKRRRRLREESEDELDLEEDSGEEDPLEKI